MRNQTTITQALGNGNLAELIALSKDEVQWQSVISIFSTVKSYHQIAMAPTRFLCHCIIPVLLGLSIVLFIALCSEPKCDVNPDHLRSIRTIFTSEQHHNQSTIHFITPVYQNRESIADFIRLSQTLSWIENLHWIIVTVGHVDKHRESTLGGVIHRAKIDHSHWHIHYANTDDPFFECIDKLDVLVKTNLTRQWILENLHEGTLYFGNLGHVYDLEFFSQIRHSQAVTRLSVGLSLTRVPILFPRMNPFMLDDLTPYRAFRMDLSRLSFPVAEAHRIPQSSCTWMKLQKSIPAEREVNETLAWMVESEYLAGANIALSHSDLERNTNLGALTEEIRELFMTWWWTIDLCPERPLDVCQSNGCSTIDNGEHSWTLKC